MKDISVIRFSPFPGMDPYLERQALWSGVQVRLVIAIANYLNEVLSQRYR
ncbi:MAG: DUF4058 family protein, partial [Cyanobacteria bacterium P01_D01_bin.44]